MPAAYLDTSIVVAYYLPEPLSDQIQASYRTQPSRTISDLVELEFVSALSLRLRVGSLDRTRVDRVLSLFMNHLESGLYGRVHLHAGHYRLARGYIARFDLPLKAPDALHLAICASGGMVLITADGQLARNAQALDIEHELIGP